MPSNTCANVAVVVGEADMQRQESSAASLPSKDTILRVLPNRSSSKLLPSLAEEPRYHSSRDFRPTWNQTSPVSAMMSRGEESPRPPSTGVTVQS
jgi:hypothetical protein